MKISIQNVSQGLDASPQPIQEIILGKTASHHPLLLLVAPYESVVGLLSFTVHLGTHGIWRATETGVFLPQARLAPGGSLAFNQPFLYQIVPRLLKDVQGKILDATLEKATSLSTVSGKTGLLLENWIPKLKNILSWNLWTYVKCTLFKTFCKVLWSNVFAIPCDETDIRKSIGLLPGFFHTFSIFCKVLQHLWIPPIEKIVVILESIHLFQFFLPLEAFL